MHLEHLALDAQLVAPSAAVAPLVGTGTDKAAGGLESLSTRSRMVSAAVCPPLAAGDRRLPRLLVEMVLRGSHCAVRALIA